MLKNYVEIKKKYTNMIGGSIVSTPNFSLTTHNPGDIIYHGTFNKVEDKLFSPSYFSMDILQSLGHVLSEFKNLISDNKLNIKKINTITSCFPFIYKFGFNKQINLLNINHPYDSSKSFGILFNIFVLERYLEAKTDKEYKEIVKTFISKCKNIKIKHRSTEKLNLLEAERDVIKEAFYELWEVYIKNCEASCFKGWANTPGYYLLGKIDYNSYLKEITCIDKNIVGLYIEKDQDEIVLFDQSCYKLFDKFYVLPNMLKQHKNNTSYLEEYIDNYLRLARFIESYPYNYKYKLQFILHVDWYNYITLHKLWTINWMAAPCANFNPYKHIKDDCAKDQDCQLYNNMYDDDHTINQHCTKKHVYKSNKITLENMDDIQYLNEYISFVKECNESRFGNIDLSNCKRISSIEDVARIL